MTGLFQDPNWPRAGAWLRGETAAATIGRVAVIGAPVMRGSITPGRCDLAPQAMRAALDRFSPFDFDGARDLRELRVEDLSDLDVAELSAAEAFNPVRTAVEQLLPGREAVVLLGGDNSITRPGAGALGPAAGLITFDAHLDLRDTGHGLTNGNPVRALLEDGWTGDRIVQIGIQPFANSAAYARVARDAGIHVVSIDEVRSRGIDNVVHDALTRLAGMPVYVDLDLDVLDRAFAPATPGSRPGGLTPYELRRAARLCGAAAAVRAIDIVEIDPTCDISGVTVLAAAACLLSFASGVHERCSQSSTARRS
jgi:formiminoglutamase